MQLTLSFSSLQLIPYTGAGNKTPVLDLSSIPEVSSLPPETVREVLEKNLTFRNWLRREGKAFGADTVMMYYPQETEDYSYVCFVGEPNASISAPFSDMCGNGIRCLTLHIYESANILERQRIMDSGVKIWTGIVRQLRIERLTGNGAVVRVNLGRFQKGSNALSSYVTSDHVRQSIPDYLEQFYLGIGMNSDTKEGEPHLVVRFSEDDLEALSRKLLGTEIAERDALLRLRYLASVIGHELTFSLDTFPRGINCNLVVVKGEAVYVATHERNLVETREECFMQREEKGICHCVTMACGTGGSVIANLLYENRCVSSPIIETKHGGGTITYDVSDSDTIMIGPAEKFTTVNERRIYAEN